MEEDDDGDHVLPRRPQRQAKSQTSQKSMDGEKGGTLGTSYGPVAVLRERSDTVGSSAPSSCFIEIRTPVPYLDPLRIVTNGGTRSHVAESCKALPISTVLR